MSVLLGDKLKKEIETLKKCPIIRQMHKEFTRAGYSPKKEYKENQYYFMTTTALEYKLRGGKQQVSIGGPAKALLAMEEEQSG